MFFEALALQQHVKFDVIRNLTYKILLAAEE